jgi:chemotaxis protein methyltransferase CheR
VTAASAPGDLADLALALRRACGIVFSDPEARSLRAGATAAAAALGVSAAELAARVRSQDPVALHALVEGSIVGETYFGRHPEQLEAIRAAVRAGPGDRATAVWSAGCASGEEAYTLALMLLEEGRAWRGAVLATDVSERGLEAARRGRYGPRSLRGLPAATRDRWLAPDGDAWSVAPEVRAVVELRRHNLVTEPPPRVGFDVVLCRNVLIYFDAPTAAAVVRRLFDAVRPGGLVALAPAEVPLAEPLGFDRLEHRGGALWRKTVRARAPRARPVARPAAPPPAAPPPVVAAPPPPAVSAVPLLDDARRAAAEGRWAEAEERAREAGERHLVPEPFLFAAAAAEARADLAAAVRWLGRALFLDPAHVVARASLVPLLERLGRGREAARARREALDALGAIADDELLPGIEPVAAGALRSALRGAGCVGGEE